jgi:HlyD family secretion protein
MKKSNKFHIPRKGEGEKSFPQPPEGADDAAHDSTEEQQTVLAPKPVLGHRGGEGHADLPPVVEGPELDEEERAAYERLKEMRAQRRHKKIRNRLIVAGIAAVVILGIVLVPKMLAPKDDGGDFYSTDSVTKGHFEETVEASGSVQPVSSVVVTPEVDGTIASVSVMQGQQVEKGQTLFTIKNDDLDRAVREAYRNLKSAKSQLAQAQQALKDAKSAAAQAQAASAQAGADQQAAALPNATSATLHQADDGGVPADSSNGGVAMGDTSGQGGSATTAISSGDAVQDAKNAVETAQNQVDDAQDAYDKAVSQADKRTVTSPISGTVLELNATTGSAVGQQAASAQAQGTGSGNLCQVADLSQMKVTVNVGENDINKVAVGQKATVTFSSIQDLSLDATVQSVAATTSTSSDATGMTNGPTYAVELLIPQPDAKVKPGMTANVSIVTNSLDDALIVPMSALTDNGDGTGSVNVETDAESHTSRTVSVTIVAKSGSQAAVTGDLKEGDVLVVSGGTVDSGETGDATATDASSSDGVDSSAGGEASGDSVPADATADRMVAGRALGVL